MPYLDTQKMASISAEAFQNNSPFAWSSFDALIRDDGYDELREALPPIERFTPVFGRRRKHGQQSHDRYVLEHTAWLDLPEPWRQFVKELKSDSYRDFVARLLGRDDFLLHFHWHYTPNGCSVSPHCDATWKLGSHIFYFNAEDDWDPSWGGETVILDDAGRFGSASAPAFEDFVDAHEGPSLGNASLMFRRDEHSWHGVREIRCPKDRYRKVFIVEFRQKSMMQRLRTPLGI